MKYNKEEYYKKDYWRDKDWYCDTCGGNREEQDSDYCDRCNEEYEDACNKEVA